MFEELKELGLRENEIRIYLALLKSGTSTPAQIAEKTGFSRPYLYDALDRLQEKEIVNVIFIKNKKHYQATNPEHLSEQLSYKLEKIERVIPELIKFIQPSKEEINVELHKGKNVYKVLLKDITSTLKNNEEVFIFGIDDNVLANLDPHYVTNLSIYFSKLKRKQIKEKVIVKNGATILKEAKTTHYRFLQADFIGNTAFEVYNDRVAIFLWGIPSYLILIKNKDVAHSYKKQFDILWEKAKERV